MSLSSKTCSLALAVAFIGAACGSEPADSDGFYMPKDNPLRIETHDLDVAAGSTARLEVGPWKQRHLTLEPFYQHEFTIEDVQSTDRAVIAPESPDTSVPAFQHFVTLLAGEPGSAQVRVTGATERFGRAGQAVTLSTVEPADAEIDFECAEGTGDSETLVLISDDSPVHFIAIATRENGDYLAGYLGRDIEVSGPNGAPQSVEPDWVAPFPMARSTFVPTSVGEYTLELPRFNRSQTFEVMGPSAVDGIDIRRQDSTLFVTPKVGERTVCRQDTAAYEIEAEILDSSCKFAGSDAIEVASESGRIELVGRPGTRSPTCEVRLSYPASGVEETIEVTL